ncbi:MAG: hypothetical protein IJZ53_12030 [Tyzzerella sp.]|nr:hypothetical protein [Tyzzerella sp.]
MKSQFIRYRRPLVNTYRKLTQDKKLNVVYFGGSVTAGYGSTDKEKYSWRALSAKWLREHFPEADIRDINTAIGESGTFLGVYRLERDILSQAPDLLFIEYAINDFFFGSSMEVAALQYETIVREVKARLPQCDIVTLITDCRETAEAEELYGAACGHERIASVYQIPTIYVGKALVDSLPALCDDEWRKYYIDIVHPTDAGYFTYYKCVEEYLHQSLIASPPDMQSAEEMEVIPLQSKHLLDGNRVYQNCNQDMLKESVGFYYSEDIYLALPETPYVGYIYAENSEAEFVYRFQGTEIAMLSNFKRESKILYSVDGGEWIEKHGSTHNPTVIAQHLEAGEHVIKLRPVFTENSPEQMKIAVIFTRDEALETKQSNLVFGK